MIKKIIRLKFHIPYFLIDEISSKIFYVNHLIEKTQFHSDNVLNIFFKEKISKKKLIQIENNIIKLVKKLILKPKEPQKNILYSRKKNKYTNSIDLRKKLLKNSEIFKEIEGVYVLGNKLTKLNNFFDKKLLSISEKYKAVEYSFPSLMSIDKLNKVGHFDNFPQSCCFAGHLKEEYELINKFKIKEKNNLSSKTFLKAALSPTVCQHLYFLLSNKHLKKNFIATAKSDCFRYESKNMNSLERTWNFNMRELIILGDQNYVLNKLNKIQKDIIDLLDEFEISYVVESANDPFFEGNYNDLISYQNAFKLKYEIRADTPYNKSTVAIGSFNNSQNIFGKKLNIKLKNKYINSACIGFGFERFAYCFVSQHGLNVKKWPKKIKKYIENG